MSLGARLIRLALGLFSTLAIGFGMYLLLPQHASRLVPSASPAIAQATARVVDAAPPTPAVESDAELPFEVPAAPQSPTPFRLVIRSIGLDSKVVGVGTTFDHGALVWDTAAFAVGYYTTTPTPGTPGNSVMAGHISSPVSHKGDVFRRLPEVHIGDEVDVYAGDRRVRFEVAEMRVVSPSAVEVMAPTPDATLTLLTCYPDRVYNKRLVVVGKLMESPS